MELDKKLFEIINSYELPPFVTEVSLYIHGFKHVEVAFFLFCLVLGCVLLGSPKKGLQASIAACIAAVVPFLAAPHLQALFLRPYPYLNDALIVKLRTEPLTDLSSFPLSSVTLMSAVAVALIYYFPKYSALVILGSVLYTLLPVHLGVAFPSDAFGSFALGCVFSYFLMNALGQVNYFKRF